MGRWHFRRSGWDKTVTKTDHERQLRRKGCWSPIPLILRRKDHVEVMGSYVIYIYIYTYTYYIYIYISVHSRGILPPPIPHFFQPPDSNLEHVSLHHLYPTLQQCFLGFFPRVPQVVGGTGFSERLWGPV